MPYAGLTNSETTEKVLGGYRLPQPKLCPPEVYELLLKCWREKSSERPNSKEISSLFNDFVSEFEPKDKQNENKIVNESYSNNLYLFSDEKQMRPDSYSTLSNMLIDNIEVQDPHYTNFEDSKLIDSEEKPKEIKNVNNNDPNYTFE